MSVITCQGCGAKANADWSVCPECGADPHDGLDSKTGNPVRTGTGAVQDPRLATSSLSDSAQAGWDRLVGHSETVVATLHSGERSLASTSMGDATLAEIASVEEIVVLESLGLICLERKFSQIMLAGPKGGMPPGSEQVMLEAEKLCVNCQLRMEWAREQSELVGEPWPQIQSRFPGFRFVEDLLGPYLEAEDEGAMERLLFDRIHGFGGARNLGSLAADIPSLGPLALALVKQHVEAAGLSVNPG